MSTACTQNNAPALEGDRFVEYQTFFDHNSIESLSALVHNSTHRSFEPVAEISWIRSSSSAWSGLGTSSSSRPLDVLDFADCSLNTDDISLLSFHDDPISLEDEEDNDSHRSSLTSSNTSVGDMPPPSSLTDSYGDYNTNSSMEIFFEDEVSADDDDYEEASLSFYTQPTMIGSSRTEGSSLLTSSSFSREEYIAQRDAFFDQMLSDTEEETIEFFSDHESESFLPSPVRLRYNSSAGDEFPLESNRPRCTSPSLDLQRPRPPSMMVDDLPPLDSIVLQECHDSLSGSLISTADSFDDWSIDDPEAVPLRRKAKQHDDSDGADQPFLPLSPRTLVAKIDIVPDNAASGVLALSSNTLFCRSFSTKTSSPTSTAATKQRSNCLPSRPWRSDLADFKENQDPNNSPNSSGSKNSRRKSSKDPFSPLSLSPPQKSTCYFDLPSSASAPENQCTKENKARRKVRRIQTVGNLHLQEERGANFNWESYVTGRSAGAKSLDWGRYNSSIGGGRRAR